MWTIIKAALGGLQGTLIAVAVSGVLSASAGFYVAHKVGQAEVSGVYIRERTAAFEAVVKAEKEQKRLDNIGLAAALALDHVTLTIEVGTANIITEIEHHVTVKSIACVPYGFVRVLDAEVLGRSADSLALPAGTTDDSCAPIDAVALARSIAANYGACKVNAAQLDALSGAFRQATAAP